MSAKKKQIDHNHYAEIFKALGHPVRLKMALGLCKDECNVSKIVNELGLPQSTVSQQLSILRNRGIIEPRREGVRTCYKVVDPVVESILEILRINS